ncbi:hypothetical protein PHET_04166, partial [Paragonimus heterotremus]
DQEFSSACDVLRSFYEKHTTTRRISASLLCFNPGDVDSRKPSQERVKEKTESGLMDEAFLPALRSARMALARDDQGFELGSPTVTQHCQYSRVGKLPGIMPNSRTTKTAVINHGFGPTVADFADVQFPAKSYIVSQFTSHKPTGADSDFEQAHPTLKLKYCTKQSHAVEIKVSRNVFYIVNCYAHRC